MPTKKARAVAGEKRKRESSPKGTNETDVVDEESKVVCVPVAKKVLYLTNATSFCLITVIYRLRNGQIKSEC